MPEQVATGIRIGEITKADDPAFSVAHALLRRAFHRAEMLPVSDWRNAMREREEKLWTDIVWHLLVARQGGRVVAAATGMYLGNVNTGVIGYIAVVPRARSYGLGPRMRAALRRRFDTDARRVHGAALDAIVGEVRDDNPWLRHLIGRAGAIALDFPYYQPSLGGTRKPVPLVLYYQPLRRGRGGRRAVSAALLRRLLYTIWRRGYRIARPMEYAEFRRMLQSLAGRRTIGSQPLRPLPPR